MFTNFTYKKRVCLCSIFQEPEAQEGIRLEEQLQVVRTLDSGVAEMDNFYQLKQGVYNV